jgi:primosomal protein N' (replication factor Y)
MQVPEDSGGTLFADLLIPVPVGRKFTYRVPAALAEAAEPGRRAVVPFGDRRILTGIILALHTQPPKDHEAKSIIDLLDDYPVVFPRQLELFHWMASYYLCTPGEVLQAALPSGLKLSSESVVQLHPAFDFDTSPFDFSEKDETLLRHLASGTMTYTEISKLLGVRNIHTILKSLVGKEAVLLLEEIQDKYVAKKQKRIRLSRAYEEQSALEDLFKLVGSKAKQEELLLYYLQQVPAFQSPELNKKGLTRKAFNDAGLSASALNTLIKQGVLEEFEVIIPRFEDPAQGSLYDIVLSEAQTKCSQEILAGFDNHPCVLLHGITGSGKTEIYIDLIRKALANGTQVLYLLPEIALTTQIVQRLRKVFGNAMGVYHSRFSDNERVDVWKGIVSGTLRFIVGVRSAVFLPFDELGLIIVDEEHDGSYKQQDPAPRYHARDVALVLGKLHHAKVLLGSATPSVESWFLAGGGRYHYVHLPERYGEAKLPEVILADLVKERKQKTMQGGFSGTLTTAVGEALRNNEQVIIFQNRRGYSPMLECQDCGWIPQCINCSVSLTYHQFRDSLICHYCGYRMTPPKVCSTCNSSRIRTVGTGTEKLEEELALLFPGTRVRRMDLDTTRTKSGYESILDEFSRGDTQILVGTQMITKGLDFDHVSVVGVFNADRILHFPDFRAHERAFQLITQVSGRAGRREKPGKVVVQTYQPDHPLFRLIAENNYGGFYATELQYRKERLYPPFSRLIEILVRHADRSKCRKAAEDIAARLRSVGELKVSGPAEPAIAKIRNEYRMMLLVKVSRDSGNLQAIKDRMAGVIESVSKNKDYGKLRIVADVDPA